MNVSKNSSKEAKEEELIKKGYRKYSSENIDIFYNKDMCTHSGKCVHGNKDVFEVGRKPWIIPVDETAENDAKIVESCPSGALKYILKNNK